MRAGPRKQIILPVIAGVLLCLVGAKPASAQAICLAASSTAQLRWEATVEALGAISLTCTGVPAAQSSISIIVNAPLAPTSDTPDNLTTFPGASLASTLGFATAPTVSSAGNTITFSFLPVAGAQTFSISGIRVNMGVSELSFGNVVQATLITSTLSLTSSSLIVGIVSKGLGPGSGFPNNPLNIIACSPAIPAPAGLPDSVPKNPDPSQTGANSLRLVFVEGFASAFGPASREDGGAGLQGTRLRAHFTGIPDAIIPYAPRAVRSTSLGDTGSVTPGGSSLVIQRVSGANPDGSGGTVLPEVADQFDRIPVAGGAAALVYEVTSDSVATLDTVTVFIALSAADNPGSATINGEFSLAPLGPPTTAPARPQFTTSTELSLSTRTLNFIQYIGSSPATQTVSFLNLGAGMLNWTVAASTESGGNWLGVSPASGSDNGSISVSIVDTALTSGTYHGAITITDAHAVNSPQTILVNLIVTARPTFSVNPGQLSFQATPGTNPASKQLQILSSGSSVPWTATVQTASGGNWLSLSSVSGITGSLLSVSVNSAGLAAGAYQGSITFSAPDSVNGTVTVSVSLLVGSPTTVVSGATFQTGAGLSRGMIASVFGANLTDAVAVAPAGTLPTTLRNSQVLVNGVAAPLFYVSPTQINFQVPLEVSGATAQVVVARNGILGTPATVSQADHAPGIFTVVETGKGAVLNEDSTLNSEGNPAQAGSVIQIFATGFGAVTPQVPSGQPAPLSPLSQTVTTPVVLIGGTAAEVTFSGLAPGAVGLNQINARIPAGVQAGSSVTLQIQIGAATSNVVNIAVQ